MVIHITVTNTFRFTAIHLQIFCMPSEKMSCYGNKMKWLFFGMDIRIYFFSTSSSFVIYDATERKGR